MQIIEMPIFTKYVYDHLSEDGYKELQEYLVRHPSMGDVIPKTGGLRKLRWATAQKGKRGGLRIIYYWVTDDEEMIMVYLYAKSDQDDLTREQYRRLLEGLK